MLSVIFFVFGAVFGSAANALIDRLPKNISWTKGRSVCDSCNHELKIIDLIPIVSYLSLINNAPLHPPLNLRGGNLSRWFSASCRYCQSPIPSRNFWVEILMGAAFVVINSHMLSYSSVLLSLIFWVTTIIAVMDFETRLVADVMVIVWGVLVFFNNQISITNNQIIFNSLNLKSDFLGLLVSIGIIGGIWLFSKGKAMGAGDIGIAAVMGWWLGWPNIAAGLWVAFVTGAVYGVIKLIKRSSKLRDEVAFGPWLILGCWVGFLFGEKLIKFIIK